MLTTMLRPTSGTLSLNGHDVTSQQKICAEVLRHRVPGSGAGRGAHRYENMMIHAVLYDVPKKDRASRIQALLELLDLWARRDNYVKTYSGGMRRRLEIARGLMHHPKILFLDEPTLGLDTQTRNLLWDYVQRLRDTEGMTIFFTTHYLDEAEAVADRIAIIDHGHIIATGTTKQLAELTNTETLEEAYLQLTGSEVRDETSLKNDGLNVRSALQRSKLR